MGIPNQFLLHVFRQLDRDIRPQRSDKDHKREIQIFRFIVTPESRVCVCHIMGIRDVVWICKCHVFTLGFCGDYRVIATTGKCRYWNVFSRDYDRAPHNGVSGGQGRENKLVNSVYHWHRTDMFLHMDVRNVIWSINLLRYYPWYRCLLILP